MNKQTKKYLSDVRKDIHCKTSLKKAFLSELKGNLLDFEDTHPDADYEQICRSFGIPENVASEFMGSIEVKEIKKAFQWKKVVLIAAVVAILILAIYVVASFIDGHSQMHGTIVENPIVENTYYVNENGEYIFETIN